MSAGESGAGRGGAGRAAPPVARAFLLAFSSDFPPRAYYQWSRARNLRGFVNFTLARAPPALAAAHNRTCR